METLKRDRDEITRTNRRMADAVTSNRLLVERTHGLIAYITSLLSGNAGCSTPAQQE